MRASEENVSQPSLAEPSTDDFLVLPSVLTFGEPLVVLVPDSPGNISTLHQFRPYPAGAELNTAVGLQRLGIATSCACSVGADPFGRLIRRAAQAEGVDTAYMQEVESTETGVFFKQWTGLQAKTSVFYYRSASPMATGRWNTETIRIHLCAGRWNWVHSTGITWMIGADNAQKSTELLSLCHRLNVPVSFDVNVRLKLGTAEQWQALVTEVLPYVTWFLLGDEEARLLFTTDDVKRLEQHLRQSGFHGKGVVLKRGEQGASASVDGDVMHVPAWLVPRVVDTVGAGDGYNAGFIAGMLRGWSLDEAMKLGSLVGAFAVTSVGDYEGYPTWKEAM